MPSQPITPPHAAIQTAEILAIGSELLVGETRDTNSGDLAAALTDLGVELLRSSQLPDRLTDVEEAIRAAIGRADLVITSGGLGPTPDDLTREAIAAVLEQPLTVSPELEAWLRGLWERRGLPFSDTNLKQAWLIPGADALPNPNGTAPGWWVEHDRGVLVALPGPPRELQPMWANHVLPRLQARGLGIDRAAETLRLTGIGESAAADLLGEELLRSTHPHVATYARVDAVDVRIWATGDEAADARSQVAAGVAIVERVLGDWVFAHGQETWSDALGARLRGRTVACLEVGTAGQLASLLGSAPWLRSAQLLGGAEGAGDLAMRCDAVRSEAGADVAVAVRASEVGDDMTVEVAVTVGGPASVTTHTAFRGGDIGRRRAATIACTELWRRLT